MRPIFPLNWFGLAQKPEAGFIYQGSRLERLIRTPAPQVASGEGMEFAIDMRRQFIERGSITMTLSHEQFRDLPSLLH